MPCWVRYFRGSVKILVAISILIFTTIAIAAKYEFDIPTSQKIVVIGDIHGDHEAMIKILRAMKLINANNTWVGGNTHLVFLGDLINRGDAGRQVMDTVMRLEQESKSAGGYVHTVLGNHELLVTMGHVHDATQKDIDSYADFKHKSDKSDKAALVRAFRKGSVYANWILSRPAALRINDSLFVHGGLSQKMNEVTLSELNRGILDWFEYYQGLRNAPERHLRWLIREEGPLFNRYLNPGNENFNTEDLDKVFKHFHVNRIAVGHTVIDSLERSFNHPEFDGRVFMLDTGISSVYNGKLSALVMKDGFAYSYKIKRTSGEPVLKRKRKLNTRSCKDLLAEEKVA
jgi:Calcineurin-like phosphoesterase